MTISPSQLTQNHSRLPDANAISESRYHPCHSTFGVIIWTYSSLFASRVDQTRCDLDDFHISPTDDYKYTHFVDQRTRLVVFPTITLAPEVLPIETGNGPDDLVQGSLVARKKKIKLPKTSTTTTTTSNSTSTSTSTATRSSAEGTRGIIAIHFIVGIAVLVSLMLGLSTIL
ncbi:hypothetical protein V865_007726 [Kwoniella europaea PYCC6329]|uniref:Uncharacterized protein n=1 Tax=Kwoniella europaea PYCC6329 TaxID=1423913 RepID=A0AAX4KTF5_9TREE